MSRAPAAKDAASHPEPDPCERPALVSVDAARAFLLERARPVEGVERAPVAEALGRVVARAERARIDVPGHDNSAMDGYAVRSRDVPQAGTARLPVTQRVAAGMTPRPLAPGEAARIFTGAPLPAGADTVVIQEDCRAGDGWVEFAGPVAAGRHVRTRGNDIAAGAEILPAGTRLRAPELGLAASVGLAELRLARRLRVAIFSTGDELVVPGEPLAPGQIYNSNRYTLLGLLDPLPCTTLDLGRVGDTLEATREALARAAAEADLIVTSGGVSVGQEDHVRAALEGLGRLELWQVAVKPGKPLAYGRIGEADFIGLPGNPVSTLVTFCLFVRPFILRRQRVAEVMPRPLPVRAGFDWPGPRRRREYLRARLESDPQGEPAAVLHARQGSDVLSSAAWAQGLVEIPEGSAPRRGEHVRYYPFSELLW